MYHKNSYNSPNLISLDLFFSNISCTLAVDGCPTKNKSVQDTVNTRIQMESYEEQISKLLRCVEILKSEIRTMRSDLSFGTKPSYTNEEVLRIFGITNPTLRKWRNEGLLGYSQIGSTYEYSQKDISDFLSSHHYEAFAA